MTVTTFREIARPRLRFVGMLVFCLLALLSCTDEAGYEDELKQIAAGVNQKCPQMMDSETRLDGIAVPEPNTIEYRFTLVNAVALNVDTQQFNKAMWAGLVANTKVSADMKKLRDHNTTLIYSYRDKLNKPISTLTISPLHYK